MRRCFPFVVGEAFKCRTGKRTCSARRDGKARWNQSSSLPISVYALLNVRAFMAFARGHQTHEEEKHEGCESHHGENAIKLLGWKANFPWKNAIKVVWEMEDDYPLSTPVFSLLDTYIFWVKHEIADQKKYHLPSRVTNEEYN